MKVLPAENEILTHAYESPQKWTVVHPLVEELKGEAKAAGMYYVQV